MRSPGGPPETARTFWLALLLVVVVSVAFALYVLAEKRVDRANEGRFAAVLLADELRQSSDDLTRMIRTYVATGDARYKLQYQEILDIREGRKPRRADGYAVSWDLTQDQGATAQAGGPAVPLVEVMRRAGFSAQELAKLEEAKTASDALTGTDYAAMALIERPPTSEASRSWALRMLNDGLYHRAKADIMRPIGEFHAMVAERTLASVRGAERNAGRLRLVVILAGLTLVFMVWRLLDGINRERRARSEGEALFEAVFDNAAVGLAQISPRGRFLNVNEAGATMLGYARDELLAAPFSLRQITPSEGIESTIAHAQGLLRAEKTRYAFTQACVRKDGRTIWLDLFIDPMRDESGRAGSFVVAAVDVTESKEVEGELARYRAQLEQAIEDRTGELERSNALLEEEVAARSLAVMALDEGERRFRFIAENAVDVIWVMDVASRMFTYVSPSVFRLRGLTAEAVMARPVLDSLTPESAARMRAVLSEAIDRWKAGDRADTMRVFEVDQLHEDGRTIRTEIITTLHGDELGNPTSVLGVTRDVTERKVVEEAVRHQAFYDGLTQLPNRRLLLDRLAQTLARARRDQSRVAFLFLDLDRFKPINDELGHQVGDWLLQSVADRLLLCLRASDTAARLGGDEFVVLLPDILDTADALTIAERIRLALDQPFVTPEGRRLEVSSSVGMALFPDHAEDERDLLRVSDEAMYEAKSTGRNRVVVASTDKTPERVVTPAGATAFLRLSWKSSYASGEAIIDTEHRELFRLVNRVIDAAMLPEADVAALEAAFTILFEHARAHFDHEEALLRERGWRRADEHAGLHRTLLARAAELRREVAAGRATVGDLVDHLAVELVARHILQADRSYFPLFESGTTPQS